MFKKSIFFSIFKISFFGSIIPLSSRLASHLSEITMTVQPSGMSELTLTSEQNASVFKADTYFLSTSSVSESVVFKKTEKKTTLIKKLIIES